MTLDDHFGVGQSPRMLSCLWVTLAVMVAALLVQAHWPGSLIAVTLYKAHLMALGGWGGYWLARALFPYARLHSYLDLDPPDERSAPEPIPGLAVTTLKIGAATFLPAAMLRRAIIVAACLLCVGLGA